MKQFIFHIIPVMIFTSSLHAGESLAKRSSLEVSFAFWNQVSTENSATENGINVKAESGGLIGALTYNYWFDESVAGTFGIGVLGAESKTNIAQSSTSVVMPVLFGVKYHFVKSSLDVPFRPFVAGAVGPYVGMQAKSSALSQRAYTNFAIGAKASAGVDFVVNRWFLLNAQIGYNLVSDFTEPIGSRKNYSGTEFSIGFGFIFGRGE